MKLGTEVVGMSKNDVEFAKKNALLAKDAREVNKEDIGEGCLTVVKPYGVGPATDYPSRIVQITRGAPLIEWNAPFKLATTYY